MMVCSVPPGGNWKNIPASIPSQRLAQIRVSCANGEGSRSTYYGRLRPDKPAYTISTYFYRPGNGCNIHYDFVGNQHRVLTDREAARLQSFPDSFEFFGSHMCVAKQIGNAVPPLLSFQIARCFGTPGVYLDIFCGAGGLSLGFKWAGWNGFLANDIDRFSLQTYEKNVGCDTLLGDITSDYVLSQLTDAINVARGQHPGAPLFILGGPPCQGFSTAGKRRSRTDSRNSLFRRYVELVNATKPDGFLFENVMGLVNMEGGAVFHEVRDALTSVTGRLDIWKLSSEHYAIPQRRKRIFLLGLKDPRRHVLPPAPICSDSPSHLFRMLRLPVGVEEAIGDLPPVLPGEDGSVKEYSIPPRTPYQHFMRATINPFEYLQQMSENKAMSLEARA